MRTSLTMLTAVSMLLIACGEQDDGCVGDNYVPCGDGICQTGEQCPEDCASVNCGNGVCDLSWGEDEELCPEDCLTLCGDNICNGQENILTCERDCGQPPLCGDNICEPSRGENDQNCFEDCGCWNGRCDSELGENEHNCYQDCGVCGNGVCGGAEDHYLCPEDCVRPYEFCGDLICEFGETADPTVEETEDDDGIYCPQDCHCGWGTCDLDETPETCPEDCAPTCGDGVCDESIGESWLRCPVDCRTCRDNPERPIDCEDGTGCWPTAVNCDSNTFLCGGLTYRCNYTDYRANCSEGEFRECPGGTPYFCRESDNCVNYDGWQECPSRETDCNTTVNIPCGG